PLWAVDLRLLNSLLVRVWDGATTMLSPVWTPMGSRFSMLQTMVQLSSWSRMTSYSTSFHLSRYSSTRTCRILLHARPRCAISLSFASSKATPLPCPPRVYATLSTTWYTYFLAATLAV